MPGTRVRDSEGHTGTVTGQTVAFDGRTVPRVRWDDGRANRFGAVQIIDREEDAA